MCLVFLILFSFTNKNEVFCDSTNIQMTLSDIHKLEVKKYHVIKNTINKPYQREEDDINSKLVIQIAENGHSSLVCADGEINSKIDWFRDGKLLNVSFRNNMSDKKQEPHITIDAYNVLYLMRVTKNEEGIYICTSNGIKTHEYNVKVVSMATTLDHDFIRYSMYLGFILSLTVTCYCAGLCIAWRRKASFVDPINLKFNNNMKRNYGENEEKEVLLNRIQD